jgi:hypothetical protein
VAHSHDATCLEAGDVLVELGGPRVRPKEELGSASSIDCVVVRKDISERFNMIWAEDWQEYLEGPEIYKGQDSEVQKGHVGTGIGRIGDFLAPSLRNDAESH